MAGFPDHQALLASPGSGSVVWESATSAEVQQQRPSSVSVAAQTDRTAAEGSPAQCLSGQSGLLPTLVSLAFAGGMYQQS
jgi:hypothetical protein